MLTGPFRFLITVSWLVTEEQVPPLCIRASQYQPIPLPFSLLPPFHISFLVFPSEFYLSFHASSPPFLSAYLSLSLFLSLRLFHPFESLLLPPPRSVSPSLLLFGVVFGIDRLIDTLDRRSARRLEGSA